jgi:hypothetical protein
MSRRIFLNAPGWCLAVVLTFVLSGCGDAKRVRALAGTYVKVQDEGTVHSRTALTLRPDYHWTEAKEFLMNGKDMLAGGRSGDAIVPPGYTDSGTFALQGVVLAVRSERDGVSHYTVSGDTLWWRGAAMAALGTAVTGVKTHGGSESFLVRQH